MEVQKIFDRLKPHEEEKKKYFFVLQINPDVVKSAIWSVEAGKVLIDSLGETVFWQDAKELLSSADKSLSTASQKLNLAAAKNEPDEVIFGLPQSWVQEDKIKLAWADILKDLAAKLELKPVGFVVITDAVVFYLKSLDGVPSTAILAGIGQQKIDLALVNLGKVEAVEEIDRSGDFGADLAEGLSRIGVNRYFPPRILLYTGSDTLDDLAQELLAFDWIKAGINFLHLPKVEVLPADFDLKAVALAGGQELKQAIGLINQGTSRPVMLASPPPPELVNPSLTAVNEEERSEPELPSKPEPEPVRWPKITFRRPMAVIFLLVVALFFLLFYGYVNFSWAQITLVIEPKYLEKTINVRLSTGGEAKGEEVALKGTLITKELEGEKSISTSGSKTLGELAKGEIKIFNGTNKEKKLVAGTSIASASGLKFTLVDEVVLPARVSAADDSPSKVVKVVAVNFGAEANLAGGSEFTIANLAKSDFVGRNDVAFSGGTSREAQVVALKDQEKVLKELTDELKQKALSTLQQEIQSGQRLLEESLSQKIVTKEFDRAVDEESDKVNLKLQLKISAVAYSEKDMDDLLGAAIVKAVPAGYVYDATRLEKKLATKEVAKDASFLLEAQNKATLFPDYDLSLIKFEIKGKKLAVGKKYLDNLAGVKSSEIKIVPRLPAGLVTFPYRSEKINLEVRQ